MVDVVIVVLEIKWFVNKLSIEWVVFFVEWFKDRFVVLIIDFMIFVIFVVYFDIRKKFNKINSVILFGFFVCFF